MHTLQDILAAPCQGDPPLGQTVPTTVSASGCDWELGVSDAAGNIVEAAWIRNDPINQIDPTGLWVEPSQILDPRDAVRQVTNVELNAKQEMRDQDVSGLRPSYWNPYSKDVRGMMHFASKFTSKTNDQFSYFYGSNSMQGWLYNINDYTLKSLNLHFDPGGQSAGHNGFIYTTKYGWIDLGHFFWMAFRAYELNSADDAYTIGIAMEYYQKVWRRDDGMRDSAFTLEDLPSDALGAKFGYELRQADDAELARTIAVSSARGAALGSPILLSEFKPTSIASKFQKFLKDAGAVKLTAYTKPMLEADANRFWSRDHKYTGPRAENADFMAEVQLQFAPNGAHRWLSYKVPPTTSWLYPPNDWSY